MKMVYEGIIMNINLLDLARFYPWKTDNPPRTLATLASCKSTTVNL